jgi:hypothetical protein
MNELASRRTLRRPFLEALAAFEIASALSAVSVPHLPSETDLEQRQRDAREQMRLAGGNPELEEKAVPAFEALERDWKRKYLRAARLRGRVGRPFRIRARRALCSRARRFRRARRTVTSRRAQSDSGGSDGDGPDGDPAGCLVVPYGVTPARPAQTRNGSSVARFGERAQLRKLAPASCGRRPWPEPARVVLRLRRATSNALPSEAGPRSGRRGAR